MTTFLEYPKPSLEDIFVEIGFGKFHIYTLIILGFVQFYDSAENILLGFLGPILNCSWGISLWASSFITMAAFIGMSLGSLIFGKLGDIHGRKTAIMICICGVIYFSTLCAASPTLIWIVITRFMIGIFTGGATTTMSVFISEIMPIPQRGMAIVGWFSCGLLGSFYITFLTYGLVATIGWRLWMIVSILPMLIIIIFVNWLPESPRYLLLVDRKNEAIEIINKIAIMNNAEQVSNVKMVPYKKGSIFDLFLPQYALTTAVMSYIWFTSGISFYGLVFTSPLINDIPRKCLQNLNAIFNPAIFANSSTDNSCCVLFSWGNMETVLLSITGEIIAFSATMIVIRFTRRKFYIQILLLIVAIVYFLINLCLSPISMGLLLMFGRGAAASLAAVTYIYTSEVFPTTIRGCGNGFTCSFGRIGSMLSPFIVNMIMVKTTFIGGTLIYCSINIVAFLLVFLLPYENKDRALLQGLEDISELTEIKQNN